jgi:hypothetical protein
MLHSLCQQVLEQPNNDVLGIRHSDCFGRENPVECNREPGGVVGHVLSLVPCCVEVTVWGAGSLEPLEVW